MKVKVEWFNANKDCCGSWLSDTVDLTQFNNNAALLNWITQHQQGLDFIDIELDWVIYVIDGGTIIETKHFASFEVFQELMKHEKQISKKDKQSKQSAMKKRIDFIIEKRRLKWTYQKISQVLGISRQAVLQLYYSSTYKPNKK